MRDIIFTYRSASSSALGDNTLLFGPGTGIYKHELFGEGEIEQLEYGLLEENNSVSNLRYTGYPGNMLAVWDKTSPAMKNLSLKHAHNFIEPEIISQSACSHPNDKMKLQDYQKEAVSQIVESLEKDEKVGLLFVDMVMGTGKTAIMAELIAKLCLKGTSGNTVGKVMTICKQTDVEEFQQIQREVHKLDDDHFNRTETFRLYHQIKDVKINNKEMNVNNETRLYTLGDIGDSSSYEDMLGNPTEYKNMQNRMLDKYVDKMRDAIAPIVLVIDEPQKLLKHSQESSKNFLIFLRNVINKAKESTNNMRIRIVFMSATLNVNPQPRANNPSPPCATWSVPEEGDDYLNVQRGGAAVVNAKGEEKEHEEQGDDQTVQESLEYIIRKSNESSFFVRILKLKHLPLQLRPTVLFKCSEFFKATPAPTTPERAKDRFKQKVMIPYMSFLNTQPNVRPLCRGKQHGVVALAGEFGLGVEALEGQLNENDTETQQVFFIVNKDPEFQTLVKSYNEKDKTEFKTLLEKYQNKLMSYHGSTTSVIALYFPKKERKKEMGLILEMFGTGSSTRNKDIEFVKRGEGGELKHCIDWLIIDKFSVGIDLFNASRMLYYGTPTDVKEGAIQLISRVIRYCSVYPSNLSNCEPMKIDGGIEPPKMWRKQDIKDVYEPIEVVLIDCNKVLEERVQEEIYGNVTMRVTNSDDIFRMEDTQTTQLERFIKNNLNVDIDEFCINLNKYENNNASSLPTPNNVWKRSLNYEEFMKWKSGDKVVYNAVTGDVLVYRKEEEEENKVVLVATYKNTQTAQTFTSLYDRYKGETNKTIEFVVPGGATPLSIYTLEISDPSDANKSYVLCLNNYKDATDSPAFDIAGKIKESIDNWKGIARVFDESTKRGTHLRPQNQHEHAIPLIDFIEARQIEARQGSLDEKFVAQQRHARETLGSGYDRFINLTFDMEIERVAQNVVPDVVANLLRMIPVCSAGAIQFFRMFGSFEDKGTRIELYEAFAHYLLCEKLENEGLLLGASDIRYIVDLMIDRKGFFETVLEGFELNNCNLYQPDRILGSMKKLAAKVSSNMKLDEPDSSREFNLVTFDSKGKKTKNGGSYIIAKSAENNVMAHGKTYHKVQFPKAWLLCGAFSIDAAFRYTGKEKEKGTDTYMNYYVITIPHKNAYVSVRSDNPRLHSRSESVAISTLTDGILDCVTGNLEKRSAMNLLECMRDIRFLFEFKRVLCENLRAIQYLSKLCRVVADMSGGSSLSYNEMSAALALFVNYEQIETPKHRLFSRIKNISREDAIYSCIVFKENVLNAIEQFIEYAFPPPPYPPPSPPPLTQFFQFLINLSRESKKTDSIKEMLHALNRNTQSVKLLDHPWWIDLSDKIRRNSSQYIGDPLVAGLVRRVESVTFEAQTRTIRLAEVSPFISGTVQNLLYIEAIYDKTVILLDDKIRGSSNFVISIDQDTQTQVIIKTRPRKNDTDKEGLFLEYGNIPNLEISPPPSSPSVTRSIDMNLYNNCESHFSYDGRRFSHRLSKDALLGSGRNRYASRQNAYKHTNNKDMNFVVTDNSEQDYKAFETQYRFEIKLIARRANKRGRENGDDMDTS